MLPPNDMAPHSHDELGGKIDLDSFGDDAEKDAGESSQMDVQVFTQWTPNPNAFKFIVSEFVIDQGRVGFSDIDEAGTVPLAKAILSLEGVEQIHFFENVITVTQDGSKEWAELTESVEVAIEQWLPQHDAKAVSVEKVRKTDHFTEDMHTIDEIMNREIRPALQADGGDLELVGYENGILSIRYEGACGSCPSSLAGTLQAIQGALRADFDSELVVVVV